MFQFWIILAIVSLNMLQAQTHGSIKGYVRDSDSKDPLIGSNVDLVNLNRGSATDLNGYYELNNLPYGEYAVRVRYIGYNNYRDTIILSQDNADIIYNVNLVRIIIPPVIYGDEITVKGHYINSFECSAFYPCDSAKAWWVIDTDEMRTMYFNIMEETGITKLRGGPKYKPTKVYCELKGNLSQKGKYGHLGAAEYQFRVKGVIKMEKPGVNDCNSGEH